MNISKHNYTHNQVAVVSLLQQTVSMFLIHAI